MSKLAIAKEFFEFLGKNKKWWLIPLIVILFGLALVIVLAESSALAPFIYTIF